VKCPKKQIEETTSEKRKQRLKASKSKKIYTKSGDFASTKLNGLYEEVGGMEACSQVSKRFHDRVAGDAVLNAIFPKNLAPTTEYLALFLAEILGGPAQYTARRGKPRLLCRHAPLRIGIDEVERWLGHMLVAMEETGLPDTAQQRLQHYFTQVAPTLSDPFISFYQMPLDALRILLTENPALALSASEGRTLLRDAAGRWDVPRVQMLLENGADARGPDVLYRASNALVRGQEAEGCAVVRLLLAHGAGVNSCCGVGQMTPLHMAARRGTVAIAELLLASGAEVEAKDTKGETPLRRAVNCGQEGVVRVLLAHGANPLCLDKQGSTPLESARQEAIRELLQDAVRSTRTQ
jgi:truncated hemoglobin YjbI